jgi:hypothetical protein
MTTQLVGLITGFAVLGLVLFIAVCSVLAHTAERIIIAYFAARTAYAEKLMEMKPKEMTFGDLFDTIEKARAAHNNS